MPLPLPGGPRSTALTPLDGFSGFSCGTASGRGDILDVFAQRFETKNSCAALRRNTRFFCGLDMVQSYQGRVTPYHQYREQHSSISHLWLERRLLKARVRVRRQRRIVNFDQAIVATSDTTSRSSFAAEFDLKY